MFLGVPTLSRYDLLERLVVSAEAGTMKPKGYLLVDNGGQIDPVLESETFRKILERGADVRVLSPGRNIGVAAAWNAILDEADGWTTVISNDDVELEPSTLETLTGAEGRLLLADAGPDASGWCLFLHTSPLFREIGPYDESFYPAYYEDSDYRQRMKLEGIEPILVKVPFKHAVRGSWSDNSKKMIRRSLEQFERKWGGSPLEPDKLFRLPFDGAPIAYNLRRESFRGRWRKVERKIYRWDVINAVMRFVAGTSYLEIGVASGETMRRVDAEWKVGVDPAPSSDGVLAANAFYNMTSDRYFERIAEVHSVTFVDGLHHADQAYRDIENACKVSRVVVVHDANPSSEAMQRVPQAQGEWTGDVWKAIARIRREGKHAARTVDADYGVAVVFPNKPETSFDWIATDDGAIKQLSAETYDDLERHRKELLGLVTFDEWLEEMGRF